MKKLLGLLVALTMAWPVTASADVLKNVDLKGEVQTIASDTRHDGGDAYGSGTNFRVLAGLSAELVEDVRANLMFQYLDGWTGNTYGNSLDDYWKNVDLVEANIVLSNLFDSFEVTVGRQFYGDEDSAVIYFGPNHYIFDMNYAESLDAAKLTYSDDFKSVTLLAGKYNNSPLGTEEYDVYGADVKLNLTDTLTAQVYGYDFKTSKDPRANNDKHMGFYGAKVGFAPEAALLSVEYARGFGGDRLVKEGHDTPYMVKADASIDVDSFTPRAAFMYAKGVVSPFGNYYPGLLIGHLLAGQDLSIFDYADGVRMFNVGVDYTLDKWVFALDGFSFQDRSAKHSATLEADLTVKYNHNEYVQLFAGLGYGKYGSGIGRSSVGGDENTKGQLGMLVKF